MVKNTGFEKIIINLFSKFVDVKSENLDKEINLALKMIGEYSNVDRSYLALFRENRQVVDNTYEWCSKGTKPQIDSLKNIKFELELPWISKKIKECKDFYISDLDTLPKKAKNEKKHLRAQKIKSCLVTPIIINNELKGFLGFDTIKVKKEWNNENISLLKIVGELLINSIERINKESFLNSLIDQNPYPMWISDSIGNLVKINRACCELLNIKEKDVIGKYNIFKDNIIAEQIGMELIKSVYNEGKTINFIIEYDSSKLKNLKVDKKNSVILDVTIAPVKNIDGKISNAIIMHNNITEKVKAERELIKNSQFINSLLEASPVAIVHLNKEGKIIFANIFAEKILGLTKNKITGRFYNDPKWKIMSFDGKTFPEEELPFIKVKKNKKSFFNIQHTIELENCQKKYLSINAVPLFDEQKDFNGLIASIDDITEKIKADNELKQSNATLKALIENTNDATLISDENAKPLLWNKTYARIMKDALGLDMKKGFQPHTLLKDKSAREWWENLHKRVLSGENFIELLSYIFPDNNIHYYEVSYCPIIEDGKITGFSEYSRDVTNRKKAEEELTQIFAMSIDMICIADINTTTFLKINPAFSQTLGYSENELLTRPFTEFIHPDDIDRTIKIVTDELKNGKKVINFKNRYRCKNGEYKWLSWVSHPNPQLGITYAIARDITEQIIAENTIKKMNEDLEERVKKRTKELESVNKELESFAYSISHDLKAPLRHISGFAQLLNADIDSMEKELRNHYLKNIINASKNMSNLIENLLNFSKLSRADVKIKRDNINKIITESIESLKPEMNGRNIEWKIEKIPDIFCDKQMIKQVFINLISNAVKYTRKVKKAKIEIGTYLEKSNERVIFIKDNGIGFDMKYAGKLFGVFQRLHSKEEYEGTGIGLANAKRIIEKHNGKIWVESKTNKGTTFYFFLAAA